MRRVEVRLDPPYAVEVGSGILRATRVPHARAAVVFDERVRPVAERAAGALRGGGTDVVFVALPEGERAKTLAVLADTLSRLALAGLTRDAAVLSVGGGAASDLAGFAAAIYLRGIAFYAAPTTLLAMVDASVGGKTGVNLPEGKNLAGAFHQPRGVWADLDSLATLPERAFREGAAEVFKHGLLAGPELCDVVLRPGFGPAAPDLEATIAAAVEVKAQIVGRDPLESGERAHLNYGHTLAHALEAASGHAMPHGDAVGYGMHFAAHLGRRLGYADLTGRTRDFLAYQRPRLLPTTDWDELAPYVARDKKSDAGGLRFVLLEEAGRPRVQRVAPPQVEAAWAAFLADLPAGGGG